MHVDRRGFNKALIAAASVGLLPTAAFAQQIKGLKIVAPAGPGGGYDQLARATQDALTADKLAAGVQVVNVPGAGGTIGLAQVINYRESEPEIMVAGLGLVGATFVNKSPVSLSQVKPLARLQGEYQPLFVGADSPIKTLADLIAKFKQDPGSVSWGGFALGSPDHILSGLVVKGSGGDVKKMNYIAVGTGGEMLPLVMGGKVTVATGGLNEVAGQFKAGRLRPLGISSPERIPGVDIPTFREQGVDATLVNWRGLLAAPNTKPADMQALDSAIGKMVQSAAWKKILTDREWIDLYLPSDRFAAFLKEEETRITALMKELGLA